MITEKEGTSQKSSHKWLNEFYSPRRSESGWIKINSRESLKCTPQMSGQEKAVPHTASTVQNRLASNIPNAAESLVRVDLVWLLLVLGMGLKDGLGETSAFKLVVTSVLSALSFRSPPFNSFMSPITKSSRQMKERTRLPYCLENRKTIGYLDSFLRMHFYYTIRSRCSASKRHDL